MAELSTLARPYARAAFEHAVARGSLPEWSTALAELAAVSQDEMVALLLSSPAYTAEQVADTLIALFGDSLGSDLQNFIQVLSDNKRLPLLQEISAQFEQYKANQEKSIDVDVWSAFELDQEAEQTLARVLTRKLEREVKVGSQVDQSLIGGVLIRAGDLVIDGSVRGRLRKLAEAMNS